MAKKFLFNFLINLGLIFCLLTLFWGYKHQQYAYMLGSVFLIGLLIIFKLRILREIKNAQKKP